MGKGVELQGIYAIHAEYEQIVKARGMP